MSAVPNQPALLANLGGPHLPPVALSVSAQYQFCVDAGAAAAEGFFDDLAIVGLHDHIAYSMQVFTSSVRVGMAAMHDDSPATMQVCIDAFAAGYLGRIQQELRLFHGESVGRNQAATAVGMFTYSRTSH
ncbi:MAG: hypothetical protein Q8R69_07785 [Telluria sp.]|nr:hypothetical protein [Telluria sp.]